MIISSDSLRLSAFSYVSYEENILAVAKYGLKLYMILLQY